MQMRSAEAAALSASEYVGNEQRRVQTGVLKMRRDAVRAMAARVRRYPPYADEVENAVVAKIQTIRDAVPRQQRC